MLKPRVIKLYLALKFTWLTKEQDKYLILIQKFLAKEITISTIFETDSLFRATDSSFLLANIDYFLCALSFVEWIHQSVAFLIDELKYILELFIS